MGRPTSSVRGTWKQVLNECWPAPAMVVEGIHVEDIFELVSLVLSLIIFWTFRILAHEEDQYTDILSIALKQTKAEPRSSGTPFLVLLSFENLSNLSKTCVPVILRPRAKVPGPLVNTKGTIF